MPVNQAPVHIPQPAVDLPIKEVPPPPRHPWKLLPDKVKVCIYRFPYGHQEHSTTVNWLMNSLFLLHTHPRVDSVFSEIIADTPVDMSRNRAIRHALDNQIDFAIFLDSDMYPDYEQACNVRLKEAQPFLPGALDFALQHDGPCCVGAPYCCAPPSEDVLVMRWRQQETNDPDGALKLDKFTREEAIDRIGMEEVAALATGMLLIDMRCIEAIPAPWFSYQWADAERTKKSGTEDVVFTRDLSLAGIPQYCYWNAWAGHWKLKLVTRPVGLPITAVPERMAQAVRIRTERAMNQGFNAKYGHLLQKEQG